jgi:hypothetical protein
MDKRTQQCLTAMTQLRDAQETGDLYTIRDALCKLFAPAAPALIPDTNLRDWMKTLPDISAKIADAWMPGQERTRVPRFFGDVHIETRGAQFELPREFSRVIKSARLVLWFNWKRKQFQPAIFCKDRKTAMFVRAVLRDMRACPCDDKIFTPERPDQEYCSIACRERYRQRRRYSKIRQQTKQKEDLKR